MSITRKHYTVEFKELIIKAAIEKVKASMVARQHRLSKELVCRWVK